MIEMMILKRQEAYRERPNLLNSNVIGEETFRLARLRLCPGLWPYC